MFRYETLILLISPQFSWEIGCDGSKEEWKAFGIELHNIILQNLESDDTEVKRVSRRLRKELGKLDLELIEELCDITTGNMWSDSKRVKIERKIIKLPLHYLKLWSSLKERNIRRKTIKTLQAYKLFVSYYGSFNDDQRLGFFEFMLIVDKRLLRTVMKHLRFADNTTTENNLVKIMNQLSFYCLASINQARLYKVNPLFRFLFEIIISKVGHPQDFLQKDVQNYVKSIKDRLHS